MNNKETIIGEKANSLASSVMPFFHVPKRDLVRDDHAKGIQKSFDELTYCLKVMVSIAAEPNNEYTRLAHKMAADCIKKYSV